LEITREKATLKSCKVATKSEITSKEMVFSLDGPAAGDDAQVLNKLKEKKESTYNALLDKVNRKMPTK
jgi:hypothetical protein